MEQTQIICLVDDDRDMLELLSGYLGQYGFTVLSAEDGPSLRRLLGREEPDLIVLDVMLPGEDGFSLCRSIRKERRVPIIFLTAVNETADCVLGLELGADDYISKPFEPRELLARIRSVLRRNGQEEPGGEAGPLYFSGWRLDVSARCLETPGGVAVHLSGAEYRLLMIFVSHPQSVLSRDKLMILTQGRSAGAFDRSIDVQVSRLRTRLRDNGKEPHFIKTLRGDGYIWAPPVTRRPE